MLDLMPSVLVAGWPVARASASAVFTGQMLHSSYCPTASDL